MGGILQVDTIQNNNATTLITQTNSTTLTFGVSGQNIVIPSGVTFNTASATVNLPSTISATTINATTLNVTTTILAAGAVGTPSLTTSGDTNTGIFFPSADTIAFTEGGTEAMRINSSANVGIGTTSPRAKTEIFDSSVSGVFSATDLSTWRVLQVRNNIEGASGTAAGIALGGDGTSDTETAGIVGISDNTTGGVCQLAFLTATGNASAERMRIDSSGNVLVGTTTPSVATQQGIVLKPGEGLLMNSDVTNDGTSLILCYTSFSTADQTKFEVTSSGNVKSRTNSYAGFSDERLKQGITPASSQWSDIKNIEVMKFQMKSEQFSDEENPWMIGVIAQQVEKVSPALVEDDVKDGMKTVKYSILYMKAVKALQEAMERIEQLETKNTSLEARLIALENN